MEEEELNLESVNVQRMLKGLSVLVQEQPKPKDDTYQEFQLASLQSIKPQFMKSLQNLYQKSSNSKILNNIVKNHNKYYSCLLAYCDQIAEVLENSDLFAFSHKAFTSQAALLAYFLSKSTSSKVALVTSEESLLRAGHMIAGEGEEDKLSFTRMALQKQGVSLHDLCIWQKEGLELGGNTIVVVDVFGLNSIQYSPLLLRSGKKLGERVIVYHNNLQDAEVAGVLMKIEQYPFPLTLHGGFPLQARTELQESALIQRLLQFLTEDRAHPEKQDAVIFFPAQQHHKRFYAKISQQLSKAGLKEYVSVVTRAHQPQSRSKNNIFIVESSEQLLTWNYDYANVLYVVDYGKQSHFIYNYETCCYEESFTAVTPVQRAKRMSIVGHTQFGIYSCLAEQILHRSSELDTIKDISIYLLKMIDFGLQVHIEHKHPRVVQALQLLERLQVIKREADNLVITDQEVLQFAKLGVSPIESKLILRLLNNKTTVKEEIKHATLAIFMLACIKTKENIRKHKHQNVTVGKSRPTEIWRKGGYIESFCAIIANCEANELYLQREGESESFRRNSSKIEQAQTDPFGSFYQLIDGADQMHAQQTLVVPNFLQENCIDQEVFYHVRQVIDHYRELFNIPKISIIFQKGYLGVVLNEYGRMFKESLLFYSGLTRKGYLSESSALKGQYIQLNSQALKIYPMKAHFISALRYHLREGVREVSLWNTVQQSDYLDIKGGLPLVEKSSRQEAEIQYHGISTLLFERLWRNNGSQILRFEEENQCFVEANQQMALILVHCEKERQKDVREKFDHLISKVKTSISASNRLTSYFGNIKFYVGAGGAIKEMVIGDYVSKCLLENLPLDTTKEDLEDLIEEFLVIRDINVRLPQPGQDIKSAVIFFYSQRDFYRFQQLFNDCEYCGRKLKVTPIRRSKVDFAWQRMSILFRWYVWQSHNKGLVRFVTQDSSKKAAHALTDNPSLDANKVIIRLQGRTLYIDNLNDLTDEIFLQQALKHYGDIEEVEILKTPLRNGVTDALELQKIVEGTLQNRQFRMEKIERGRNGLRSCIIHFEDYEGLKKVVAEYNQVVGRLGVTRLHTLPHFQRSMQISDSLRSPATAILQELLEEYQSLNLVQRGLLKYDFLGEQIVFRSSDKTLLDNFYNALSIRIKGTPIKLKKGQKNLVFNEIGLANLMDLEEKFNCKLVVNVAAQTLTVISRVKFFSAISTEISTRISNSFFYKIHLNSRSYRHFQAHPKLLTEVKQKNKLKFIQLEADQQSIIIEGGIVAVQAANIHLMFLVESLTQPEENRVHSDVCGICCEEPKASYRLQSCFHRFCIQCLQQYIRNVLGDASQFPIKCPHCSQLVIVEDLGLILDKAQWQKTETLGINRFISDNSATMSFCYTAGCKQINIYNGPVYNCDTCKFSYCNKCKEIIHPGFTCDQAIEIRQTDAYFLKYMVENNIRKCPNHNCGMPVVKIDGCNKVLCTRCSKSMCFKCPPEKMIAYDTPQEAYDHLNAVHGGYW